MTKLASEQKTVQNPLIRYADEIGWEYVRQEEALALRKGEKGLFFSELLRQKLLQFNKGILNKSNVDEVINRLEAVRNNIEGNAEVLQWLRGEQSVFVERQKRRRNVTLINFKRPSLNQFHVTDEWQYTNGRETRRADVMFLINGVPVAIVETKSARKSEGIEEALTQIRQYHNLVPEMLTAPQVFNITHLIDFFYGVTWNLGRKNVFRWKTKQKDNFEKKVKTFFDHKLFLKTLEEWILFFVKDDELQKCILRQHQSRAVDKTVARCEDPTKKTGLIWHTQGSGKTFTMITAAKQILERREVFGGKPTVILMIDRNELEGQLSGWVERILGEFSGRDIKIETATSKARLQELLQADFRGLIVSMIHKFEGIPKDICTRDNVFVFIDEAHRSTGGDLGNYLVGALPNATLIGFTGTPIDKTAYGKGTFKIFGKEDDQGYLDKYSIAESIEDKTTVKLNYALAPNEIRVPHEQLEKEFLELVEAQGVSEVDDLNKILDRAVNLKGFLKSNDRVPRVAEFVKEHFLKSVEPLGYKAFLVAVDREACAIYKEALDKLLPPEYTSTIYTPAQHDSERYPLVHTHQVSENDEKKLRKAFIKPDKLPKIFVVTDKLLTGFDAPVLYTMYLDKPMRDHVLLQAIARVNRPYEDEKGIEKPCGLVVDFVGIFEKLEKALAFDSDVVSGVIENIDVLMARFEELMKGQAKQYLSLTRGPLDDKTVEKAIDAFADKEHREAFFKVFKELETLYEILSPRPELRDYIEDFRALSVLHEIVRNAFSKRPVLYGDIARKTEMLVRETATAEGLYGTMETVEIDENTLEALKDSGSSDTAKVINLTKSLLKTVEDEADQKRYLVTIGQRAEAIIDAFDGRQTTTQEALKQLKLLIKEVVEAQREQDHLGFNIDTFTIYWILKQEKLAEPQAVAPTVNAIFLRFPHFVENITEMRQLKAELYKLFLPIVGKDKMITLVERLLDLRDK